MERPCLRPHFKRALSTPSQALLDAIRMRLQEPRARIVGYVTQRHAHLTVRARDQHFWSPHLSLDLLMEDDAHPDTVMLRGRYAPHPSVWTGFMGMYGVLSMAGLAGCVYSWSQVLLGQSPNALWTIPIVIALASLLYALALNGQRLAQPQMHLLQDFLDGCVKEDTCDVEQASAQQARGQAAALNAQPRTLQLELETEGEGV